MSLPLRQDIKDAPLDTSLVASPHCEPDAPEDERPATSCDASDASRIRHWVLTGAHVIAKDVEKKPKIKHGVGSFTVEDCGYDDEPADDSLTSPSQSSGDQLVGRDNDLLIPTVEDIRRTYHSAHLTWQRFVSRAKGIPRGRCPRVAAEPSILLKDVPAIPEYIPPGKRALQGVPVWRVRSTNSPEDA